MGKRSREKMSKEQSDKEAQEELLRAEREAEEVLDEDDDDMRDVLEKAANDNETIDVDFGFFDAREDDFHSAKQFLTNYTDDSTSFDFSGFTNILVEQESVGSFIKNGEITEPVLGFLTAISLSQHKEADCVKQITKFITSHAPKSQRAQVASLLSAPSTGLIVSERLQNLPAELTPPLLSSLKEDINWAFTNGEPAEDRHFFRFKTFVIISRLFKDDNSPHSADSDEEEEKAPRKRRKHKKQGSSRSSSSSHSSSSSQRGGFEYQRPEEQFFEKHSSLKFSFAVKPSEDADAPPSNRSLQRTVMFVDHSKMQRIIDDTKKLL